MQKDLKISPTSHEVVSLSTLIPNDWNPNVMNERDAEKLKEHIDKSGGNYEQPILVRKLGKGYQIVDGYHRYLALKELGFDEAYVCIEELSDKDARLRTIQMNKFRGDFDTMKLATLIRDLKENHAVTNNILREVLGYEPEEIFSLESFLDFNAEEFIKIKDPKVEEEDDTPIEEDHSVLIELTSEEAEEINAFVLKTGMSLEQAIYAGIVTLKQEYEEEGSSDNSEGN